MLKDLEKGNWIIPPWDPRYGKLGHIWKKYNYDDLISGEGRNLIRYFIPPELVIHNYITSKVEVLNKLSSWEDCNVVSCRSITRILLNSTGLTQQNYFDLLIRKINKYEVPRCHQCKTPLTFTYLSNGYGHHNWDQLNDILFCSPSCTTTYLTITNRGPNSIRSNIKKSRSQFLSAGQSDDICVFYVTWTKGGLLKYGVAHDLTTRMGYASINDSYINPKVLLRDTRVRVANLEAGVKSHFEGREYLNSTELRKLFKTIRLELDRFKIN